VLGAKKGRVFDANWDEIQWGYSEIAPTARFLGAFRHSVGLSKAFDFAKGRHGDPGAVWDYFHDR